MRSVFNKALLRIARNDRRVHLVLADIGYGEIEPFAEALPNQYLNVGVAEQNMTGVAAGLALEGNIAVTYSIANFPTIRCLEQIRNDVCYHRANVKIVIIGGGLSYGALGVSHHATEDLAIMRSLPDLVVLAPADFKEAEAATKAMMDYEGPVYYRCGYKNEPVIHDGEINFQIGRALRVRDGGDVTLIGIGTILARVMEAADRLEQAGLSVRVLSMHTLKPLDRAAVLQAARETGGIVTVEEHNRCGGLGGAVAEVLAEAGGGVPFRIMALDDTFVHEVGSHGWLLDRYGLSVEAVMRAASELVRR